jgi:hypothetical protein
MFERPQPHQPETTAAQNAARALPKPFKGPVFLWMSKIQLIPQLNGFYAVFYYLYTLKKLKA